jgi:hypothetical protein
MKPVLVGLPDICVQPVLAFIYQSDSSLFGQVYEIAILLGKRGSSCAQTIAPQNTQDYTQLALRSIQMLSQAVSCRSRFS